MKKVFAFRVSLMNGTVTANTHVEVCASRELAEQVREAVRRANEHNNTLGAMRLHFSDIDELTLWENADEVPVLNGQPEKSASPTTREKLERERDERIYTIRQTEFGLEHAIPGSRIYNDMQRTHDNAEQRLNEINEQLKRMEDGV